MPPRTKAPSVATTAQALGSLLKSARDIMRKDKGLNGDLDRLPLLTWIMFLKFLDDLETQREQEAALSGKPFRPAIEPPYRWREWAANPQGITGDELLAFINQDEAIRPDGKRGAGLFAYLRHLTSANGDDRRDVIATVFRGVDNRMKSGYLLRDVINKVAGIHFTSSDELHTLGCALRIDAPRDAGRSGRFGRVLHAPAGGAVKTVPLQFEEFGACQAWWTDRQENERAWTVPAAELLANNCNLDRKNPRAKEDIAHLPPEQIAASILEKEQRIVEIMQRIQKLLAEEGGS